MTQPAHDRLWPEEMICGCGHGECTVCLARSILEDMKRGKTQCWMHPEHCDACFICNLIKREQKRIKGEAVAPPLN